MASRSWNRVELIGNLTRDPELRFVPSGTAVATFGIATNRSYVYEGERKEEVDFHRVVAWGKLAELCSQLLKKGNRVFISGRLQYREWETQDGQKKRDAEIVLEDMILLTSKGGTYGEDIEEVRMESSPAHQASSAESPKAPDEKESKEVSVSTEPDDKPAPIESGPAKPNEKISDEEVADLPF